MLLCRCRCMSACLDQTNCCASIPHPCQANKHRIFFPFPIFIIENYLLLLAFGPWFSSSSLSSSNVKKFYFTVSCIYSYDEITKNIYCYIYKYTRFGLLRRKQELDVKKWKKNHLYDSFVIQTFYSVVVFLLFLSIRM